MRLLWQHRYLERPRAIRPTKILTEEIVYGLGKQGARLLEREWGDVRIKDLDWTETPKKQVTLGYVDHQLAIATLMVCLRIATQRRGVELGWDGHFNRRRWRLGVVGEEWALLPDAHFVLKVPSKGVAHHFVEVDRGHVKLKGMRKRYERYFRFWRQGKRERSFKNFRVLTITENQDYVPSLRRAAAGIGRGWYHGQSWRALMFSDFTAFSLEDPESVLGEIWQYADEGEWVGLV